MNDVSVVIVAWNCREYILECLRSLQQSETHASLETIVIDNASADGTREAIGNEFPKVRLIGNQENVGFARANNQGFRLATGRYLLLLNPDTFVQRGAVGALVRFMDSHGDAGAAGPMMLNGDGTLQSVGVRFPSNWNIFVESLFLDRLFPRSRLFGRHKEAFENPEKERRVDYVQGACMIVRPEVVNKVGALDEQFFMYFEEVDWCRRMTLQGFNVYYVPQSKIIHFGNTELGHFDERRLVYYHRSLLFFYRKHYSRVQAMALRILLVVRSIIRICVWACVALRPSLRMKAASCMKGYAKTIVLAAHGGTPRGGTPHG